MNVYQSLSSTLLVFLCLAACSGKIENPKTADRNTANKTMPMSDDAAAEISAGKFRADTSKVFFKGKYDQSSAFVVISKRELRLNVYATVQGDTTLIARYPVCLSRAKGQKQKRGDMKTPESTMSKPFSITQIQDAHTWKHDFGDGRGNILSYGAWFMRLKTPFQGIGIHGSTNNEAKMPGRDSEGCIRLRDKDLVHFKNNYATVGMKVIIKAENEGRLSFEKKK